MHEQLLPRAARLALVSAFIALGTGILSGALTFYATDRVFVQASRAIAQSIKDMAEVVGMMAVDIVSVYVRRRMISRAPGWRLNAFAKRFFPKKMYERVLQPTLSDMETEYAEALAEGDETKARLVRWRGVCSFWLAIIYQLPVSAGRLIVKIWTLAG